MRTTIEEPNTALPELYATFASTGLIERLLEVARDEDLSVRGDITTSVLGLGSQHGHLTLRARERGVVAGLAAVPDLYRVFGVVGSFEPRAQDGDTVEAGQILAMLDAARPKLLSMERTLLNLVGRLSGIATLTARYVDAVRPHAARVLDTRKTTPGLRLLEKYAVCCGGGTSHRLGLHDAVLVKDNHLAGVPLESLADRVSALARRARALNPPPAFIEIEVDRPDQFERLLRVEPGLIDVVLLDNFTIEDLRSAVSRRQESGSAIRVEASGGVTLETVREVAATGVDRISIGSLTHHAVSMDVALDAE